MIYKGKEDYRSIFWYHAWDHCHSRGVSNIKPASLIEQLELESVMAWNKLGLIHLHPNGEEAQTRGDHEGERGQPKRLKVLWEERIVREDNEKIKTWRCDGMKGVRFDTLTP